MMEKIHVEQYEEVFQLENAYTDNAQEKLEQLRDKSVIKYRAKTIKSGEYLEVEIYPIWQTALKGKRVPKKESRTAQKNLDNKNAQKHLIRLLNTNFNKQDIWLTLTYNSETLPASPEAAKKDMEKYIRRIKRYIKRNGLEDLKYVYVTEYSGKRVHHHIIMNFKDRDKAEEFWCNGGRTQSRRLQPDDMGLTGIAKYIMKEKRTAHEKRYTASRNLEKPKVTVADSKFTRKKVEKIAREDVLAEDVFEKMYQNYGFKDMEVKYSSYTAGAYLYVRMKRIEPIRKRKDKEYELT